MKPLCFFLVLFITIFTLADEKYLVTRQPWPGTTQVGEVVNVPPNAFFIADATGKLKPRLPLPADILGVWGAGTVISSFAGLQASLADPNQKRLLMANDIVITANVTVPVDKTVVFNGYKWRESSSQTVLFWGQVDAGRYQIFQNWEVGDVKGTFKSHEVYPEWWGMTGSTYQDGRHDEAINSAIQAFVFGANGLSISLAPGTYWVSRPLDMRGTHCRIKGAGSGVSYISATQNWTPLSWDNCTFFAWTKTVGRCDFTTVTDSGGNIELTTENGGTVEFRVGAKVTIASSSVPGYNGEWTVLSVADHNTAVLDKPYTANATGVATPVTLDSVMESGDSSHSALVWMGGTGYTGVQSFHTGLEGVAISGYYAVRKWPLKRVSGISWTGYVEELSIIKDISVSSYSGFGIGGQHPLSINTVNGLTITNFNFANAVRRGAVSVFFGPHGGVHALRDGTLDLRTSKSSTQWADGGPPAYFETWPQFGVFASGSHSVIENVHMEGAGNGIHIFANNTPGSVFINSVDMIWGMDNGMRWYDDSANRIAGPAPALATQEAQDNTDSIHNFIFHWSCLVSIGRAPLNYQSADNYNSNVVCKNLRTIGNVKYVIRDWVYGVELDSWSNERLPNQDGSVITSYERGIPYGLPSGSYPSKVAGAYYNKLSPAVDKTYFTLIR